MIIQMTYEMPNEVEARKAKQKKAAMRQSYLTNQLCELLEFIGDSVTKSEKESEEELSNFFRGNETAYFSELTRERFCTILVCQAEKATAATLKAMIPIIEQLLELSEKQDKTAVYNARKVK